MFRIAVIQNQSESQRSSYANVSRNLSQSISKVKFEFHPYDSGNIGRLLSSVSDDYALRYDAIFVSTNATSDSVLFDKLNGAADVFEDFLNQGGGLFLSYQKKLSFADGSAPRELPFIPERYRVHMIERPAAETDSGVGDVRMVRPPDAMSAAAYLVVSSPNSVSAEDVLRHCKENDFKTHLYRACLRPSNPSVYEPVLNDPSYTDDFADRNLLLVNRNSEHGERVVVTTIALDWEGHFKLLENILEYIAAGIPRLALIGPRGGNDDEEFRFLRSTARIGGVPLREYSALDRPPGKMNEIHDVYVVSSNWAEEDVLRFWDDIAKPSPREFVDASQFRRVYHLGGLGRQSLTKYVNFTPLDTIINEALLWLDHKFSHGFWEGGFWNTHDVLTAFDSLGVDLKDFLPSTLGDIQKHLRDGAYDAVMGPTCGVLALLNRLSRRYGDVLDANGFDLTQRTRIAIWICESARDQSELARQVASQALFAPGGDAVVSQVSKELGDGVVAALRRAVRQVDYLAPERIAAYSNADLTRLLELASSSEGNDGLRLAATQLLVDRQDDTGRWGTSSETGAVVASLLQSSLADEPQPVYDAILRGVEAIQADFNASTSSWGENVQHTAACIRALGLFNRSQHHASQEALEVVELRSLVANRAAVIGQARLDLAGLFAREQERELQLRQMAQQVAAVEQERDTLSEQASHETRRALWFQRLAVVAALLLLGFVGSLLVGQPKALLHIVSGAGSVLGLVVGAIIAVPVTLWLAPHQKQENSDD